MLHLAVASDIVAYQVAGTPEELQQRVGKGAGVHSPYVEDTFADPLPCDVSVADLLTAYRAVVAPEHVTAIGTTALLQLLVGI